jgi:D-galactose 1-dehydrogenase
VFEPGGMGVFDPGINALSILTAILPQPVHLKAATLEYPANRQTPIAAELSFTGGVSASFDWRQEGPQTWDIVMQTEQGTATLRNGGARFFIGEALVAEGPDQEYAALYARMAELVQAGQSDVDLSPMLHVTDAYSLGRRVVVEAFHF